MQHALAAQETGPLSAAHPEMPAMTGTGEIGTATEIGTGTGTEAGTGIQERADTETAAESDNGVLPKIRHCTCG